MDPRFALDDLDNERREEIGTRLQRGLQSFDIAERYIVEAEHGRAEATLKEIPPGGRHSPERQAMEAVPGREYPDSPGPAAG